MKNNSAYFLFCFFFTFFLLTAIGASKNLGATFVLLILGVLLYFGLALLNKNKDIKTFNLSEALSIVASAGVGAIVTYFLIQYFHLTSVVSASLVGVLGYFLSEFYKKHNKIDIAAPIYCGAFVGMAASSLLSSHAILASGFLSGIIFVLAHGVLNGCGGKLGTIAFISCVITITFISLFRF